MKRLNLKAGTVARARSLRKAMTPEEKIIWCALREGFPEAKFRRQVPFGAYFADFASHAAKLIIELDGGQHAQAKAYDDARTAFLHSEGYRVIRFWNNDVNDHLDGVLAQIQTELGHD